MKRLARALPPSMLLIPLLMLLHFSGVPSPAGADAQPVLDGYAFYGVPFVFSHPDDPLQAFRWSSGLTLPRRLLMGEGRRGLKEAVDYDPDEDRVLVSYLSGEDTLIPAVGYTREEYTDLVFRRQLRRNFIITFSRILEREQRRQEEGLFSIEAPFQIPFTEKIFGEGAPSLRVSGSERITISGTSSWVVGQKTGERGGGSLFPKLDMRQQLNVNLRGTIGSKLFVDVAQNSEALTPLENSIKIRYKGEEDEILRSVELGNTNLSLPGTQYISFSTRQEGLFGVKAEAQVGDIGITAIASRQEGEPGQTTLVGGNQEQSQSISDLNPLRGRRFFISDPDSVRIPRLVPGSLRVYLDDIQPNNDIELAAIGANVTLDPRSPTAGPLYDDGQFHQLEPERDYVLFNDDNFALPLLVLNNSISDEYFLAVAYQESVMVGGVSTGEITDVGTINVAPGDTLIDLKMIRPGQSILGKDLVTDPWGSTRRLELKNVYMLGARNIDRESFVLQITRDSGNFESSLKNYAGEEIPYIEILGLDQKNNQTGERVPDGKVDDDYIDYDGGLLYFPDLRPFDPNAADIFGTQFRARSWPVFAGETRPDTLGWEGNGLPSNADIRQQQVTPEIYDLRVDELRRNPGQYHKYNIDVSYRTAVNTLQLGNVGSILEGSETIRLNGAILQRGTDYVIYYDTGVVELKNADATAPGADLVVTYSYDSPFSRGNRSLVGASLQYTGDSRNYYYSTSWLTESRGAPEARPRIGQEPTKTTVGDLSGQATFRPWGLTRLVDNLPLVSSTAPSQLNLNAALGLSFPDPNTKNVVYIDDMEGAELVTAPGLQRSVWSYSSRPVSAVTRPEEGGLELPLVDEARGKLLWFSPNRVRAGDLNPELDPLERDDFVGVLETVYIPGSQYNVDQAWGGLVTSLSPTGVNLEQAQYIDLWINDYVRFDRRDQRRGEIRIDIGRVSEDAVWDPLIPPRPANGTLDFEDIDKSGGTIGADEDRGLDRLPDSQEILDPEREGGTTADPAGDNYRTDDVSTGRPENTVTQRIEKYRGLNGTDNNDRADTEDLNNDFRLQTENAYYEYTISLQDSALIDVTRDYTDIDFGSLDELNDPATNGWRLYRIPLNDPDRNQVGIPDLSSARHLRVWFRGVDPGDTLDVQIAGIEIVANRWEQLPVLDAAGQEVPEEELQVRDALFNVAVVNNKENKDIYRPPQGVQSRDGVFEREQSVSLEFENFPAGYEYRAFRSFPQPKDYTLYRDLAYFVNPRSPDPVEFFLRFGSNAATDTLSYYEVAIEVDDQHPLRRPDDGWIPLTINIPDLSAFKVGAPTGTRADSFLVGPDDVVSPQWGTPPRASIGDSLKVTVRGQPSFSQIRRITMGLRNRSGQEIPLGQVWFDDLRMGAVRRDKGWIGRASASVVLADLATITGSVNITDEDFVRLGQSRGLGARAEAYDLSSTVNLHKFLEGSSLQAPLRFSTKREKRTPKFFANSDIEFSGENSGRDITELGSRNLSLSVSRVARGQRSPITRLTIDALSLNGGLSSDYNNQVARVDSTWRENLNVNYNLNPNLRPLRLLNRFDFSPWPSRLGVTWSRSRVERHSYARDTNDPTQLNVTTLDTTRTGTLDFTLDSNPIRILSFNYASQRDLIDGNFQRDVVAREMPAGSFLGLNIGREISQRQGLTANYTPPFGGAFRPRLTWSSDFNQSMSPSLTRDGYDKVARNVGNGNNVSLSLTLPVGRFVKSVVAPPAAAGNGGNKPDANAEARRRADERTRMKELERQAVERQQRAAVTPPDSLAARGSRDAGPAPGAAPDSTRGNPSPPGGVVDEGSGTPAVAGSEPAEAPGKSATVQLRQLFTDIITLGDVQTSGQVQRRSTYSGINGSPPLAYRLGLTRDVGLGEDVSEVFSQPNPTQDPVSITNDTQAQTVTFRGNTSVVAFRKVTLDFNYQKRVDRNRTNSTDRIQDDTTWPEVRINWGDIHQRLPLVKKLFSEFRAVSSTYTRSTSRRGTEENPEEQVTINSSWRPLIRLEGTVKGGWRTRFSLDRTSSETVSSRTGSPTSTTQRNTLTISSAFSKTFVRTAAGGGGGKNIDLTIDTNYTQSTSDSRREGISQNQERKQDNLTIRTTATVKFSRTISGTFGLNLGQQRDVTADLTTRSVGVSFATGFNF